MSRRIQIGLALAIGVGFVLTIAHYQRALATLADKRERATDRLITEVDDQLRGACRSVDSTYALIYSAKPIWAAEAISDDPDHRLRSPSGDYGLTMRCLPLYVGHKGRRRIDDEFQRRVHQVDEGVRQGVGAKEHNARMMHAWRLLYDEYRSALEIHRRSLPSKHVCGTAGPISLSGCGDCDEYRRALEIRPSFFALRVRSWLRRPDLAEKEW